MPKKGVGTRETPRRCVCSRPSRTFAASGQGMAKAISSSAVRAKRRSPWAGMTTLQRPLCQGRMNSWAQAQRPEKLDDKAPPW